MDPSESGVKPRRYDASRRRTAAAGTRRRILDAAEMLLLRDGYAATTVAAIAAGADVSAVLVYKTFGGKAGLVAEIVRRGLAGAGPVPAPERSAAAAAGDQPAAELLRTWATLATEVAPRTTPIALLVREAAAAHPELAAVQEEIGRQRLERMAVNAERLTRHPGLRAGLSVEWIRDVLWTHTAPEFYDLLVRQRGWSIEAYGDFLYAGMAGQLLDPAERR